MFRSAFVISDCVLISAAVFNLRLGFSSSYFLLKRTSHFELKCAFFL